MGTDIKEWLENNAELILRRVGIRKGQRVLDFGCGSGAYSIPTARIVGKKGLVYALDKDKNALKELQKKATKQGLENITLIETSGTLNIDLQDNSVDVVLAYDILHIISDRKKLYKEFYRILKHKGLFSIYPKHNKLDDPKWELKNMTSQDIKEEIESYGFFFTEKYCDILSHNETLNQGCILNFKI